MTTGRINQVTIVNPSAEANERTPRRRPDVPDGREKPKRPQPQASEAYKTPKPRATDSIAPTEFPKLRSATGGTRLLHRLLPRHIRPSGGEDSSQVNAQARVLDRAIPEDLVKRLAKPAIHRPQMVPASRKTSRTSVPPTSALQ